MYFRDALDWWKHHQHDLPIQPHDRHHLQLPGHPHQGQGDDGDSGGSSQGSGTPWWLVGLIAVPSLGAAARARSRLGLPILPGRQTGP